MWCIIKSKITLRIMLELSNEYTLKINKNKMLSVLKMLCCKIIKQQFKGTSFDENLSKIHKMTKWTGRNHNLNLLFCKVYDLTR